MKTGIFSLSSGSGANFVLVTVAFPNWKILTFSEIWKKKWGIYFFFFLEKSYSPTVGEIPTSTFKKWENPLSHNWKLLNSKILMKLWAFNTTLPEKKKVF